MSDIFEKTYNELSRNEVRHIISKPVVGRADNISQKLMRKKFQTGRIIGGSCLLGSLVDRAEQKLANLADAADDAVENFLGEPRIRPNPVVLVLPDGHRFSDTQPADKLPNFGRVVIYATIPVANDSIPLLAGIPDSERPDVAFCLATDTEPRKAPSLASRFVDKVLGRQ